MHELHRSRLLVAFLCLALLGASIPLPVGADRSVPEREEAERANPAGTPAESLPPTEGEGHQASSLPPPEELDASLEQARERIKEGDYDKAIEILKATIERARDHHGSLRNAYLQLVKTYVFLGNDLKFRPQSREASNLNYQEAKKRIAECLRIRELRHTRPEPASEYPPEMIGFFAEVRSQIFGSFRVVKLEPPGAVVLLDADTLRALPGDSLLGDVDLLVRPYLVVVRARGYKDITEEIMISPNGTSERSYRLSRKRSPAWYATASTAALAVVAGLFAAVRNTSGPPVPEPLPPAPPPPTR